MLSSADGSSLVFFEPLERSEAVERLERLERTDPRDERSEAVERLERLERAWLIYARRDQVENDDLRAASICS